MLVDDSDEKDIILQDLITKMVAYGDAKMHSASGKYTYYIHTFQK